MFVQVDITPAQLTIHIHTTLCIHKWSRFY